MFTTQPTDNDHGNRLSLPLGARGEKMLPVVRALSRESSRVL
jgi:hypothetical protein